MLISALPSTNLFRYMLDKAPAVDGALLVGAAAAVWVGAGNRSLGDAHAMDSEKFAAAVCSLVGAARAASSLVGAVAARIGTLVGAAIAAAAVCTLVGAAVADIGAAAAVGNGNGGTVVGSVAGKDETPNKARGGCCTRPKVNANPAAVGPDVGAKVVTGEGEISAGCTTTLLRPLEPVVAAGFGATVCVRLAVCVKTAVCVGAAV